MSTSFAAWLRDHPYKDPRATWPADAVTQRTFFAAARAEAQRRADKTNAEHSERANPAMPSHFLQDVGIGDWADLALPAKDLAERVEAWGFRTHRSSDSAAPEAFDADVRTFIDWMEADARLDDPDTDDGTAIEIRDWLFGIPEHPARQAEQIALFAASVLAVTDPPTDQLPRLGRMLDLIDAYTYCVLGDVRATTAIHVPVDAVRSVAKAFEHARASTPVTTLAPLYAAVADQELLNFDDETDEHVRWIGEMVGLTYAAVLRHLSVRSEERAAQIQWMLHSARGRKYLSAYVHAARLRQMRVELLDGSESGPSVLLDAMRAPG